MVFMKVTDIRPYDPINSQAKMDILSEHILSSDNCEAFLELLLHKYQQQVESNIIEANSSLLRNVTYLGVDNLSDMLSVLRNYGVCTPQCLNRMLHKSIS